MKFDNAWRVALDPALCSIFDRLAPLWMGTSDQLAEILLTEWPKRGFRSEHARQRWIKRTAKRVAIRCA